MASNQKIALIHLTVAIVGGVGGWLLSDARDRGAENQRMNQLEKQVARLPEIENQRQLEKDRADRLELESASLLQRIDEINKAHEMEVTQLRNSLEFSQKELKAAIIKASALQKCAYFDELTKESKKALDNSRSTITIVGSDAFGRAEAARRAHLLSELEQNRKALLECLKN